MNTTTVAVTGASGHIGNVVCRMLLEKGYRVKAFYNSDSKAIDQLPVEKVKGSILNKEDLSKLIEGCETVIHCAALISIHGDPTGIVMKTNTEGPKNILEISRQKGVRRIIHVSSVHAVTEIPFNAVFDETRAYKTAESYVYDYSKAVGEQIMLEEAKTGSIEVIVVRPSLVLGPLDFKPSEIGKAMIDLYNQKIPALPEGGYDFVDVRNVAESIVSAIEHGKNGSVYLLTGKYHTMKQLAQVIQKVTGKKMPQVILPYWMLRACLPFIAVYSKISGSVPQFTKASLNALKSGHPLIDHSKAKNELGHSYRTLEETVGDFYEWQRKENRIK